MDRLPLAWRPGVVGAVLVLVAYVVVRPACLRRTGRRLVRSAALAAQLTGELVILSEHRITRWCRAHRLTPLRSLGRLTDEVDRRVVRRFEGVRARLDPVPHVKRGIVIAVVATAFTPSAAWLAMDRWPHTGFARSTRTAFARWSDLEDKVRLGRNSAVAAEQIPSPSPVTTAPRPHLAWFLPGSEAPQMLGLEGDVAAPADLDGDGTSELVVFRPATGEWFIGGRTAPLVLGVDGDVPVPADYLGSGHAELAVFRPATGEWLINSRPTPFVLGQRGDVPVPAHYGGTGSDVQPAVYRPSTGEWLVAGMPTVRFGEPGDVPVPGDYDGDGRAEPAVYRPSTGEWWVMGSAAGPVVWGAYGDVPVPAAYPGSPRTLPAVYRPDTGELQVVGREPIDLGTTGGEPVVVHRRGQVTLAVVQGES